ncbi:MAG: LysR substrate-binding domain-containing protein [Gammaproteobacteria bacterium]
MLPTDQINVFVHVVREGSLAGASRRLAMPTSTVSRKLAELEQRLGRKLVHRSTRKLSLTEDGRFHYEQFLPIIEQLEQVEQQLALCDEAMCGALRITSSLTYGIVRLQPLLALYAERHPRVRVQLLLSNENIDLVGEGYDVAFRLGPLADTSLVARRVDTIRYRCCASPDYLAGVTPPARPADLAALRCIGLLDRPGTVTWSFENGAGSVEQVITPQLMVNDPLYALKAAVAGEGIAYLPEFMVQESIGRGELRPVLEGWSSGSRDVFALYHHRRIQSPPLRELLALIEEAPPGAAALPMGECHLAAAGEGR